MAIKQIAPTMDCKNRMHDFIIDTDDDAASLPETCASGSTALSCASGKVFIVNASGVWVELGGAAATAATLELDMEDPYAMPAMEDPYAVAATADLGGDL